MLPIALLVALVVLPVGLAFPAGSTYAGYDYDADAVLARTAAHGLASPTRLDAVEAFAPQQVSDGAARLRHADDLFAPQSVASIRGLAGAGDDVAQGGVYALRDPITGQVVRTGRTNDLTRRAGEHLRDPALADFDFEIVARTDIYAQQRGLEQLAHDAYAPALNRIRPISPTNPNRTTYLDAAEDFLSIYGGG